MTETTAELPALPAREPRSTHVTGALAMLASAILFGSAAVPAKKALEHIPPFVLADARWVIALAIILTLLWRRGERPVITPLTWVLGLTGLALFYLFYSYGLRHTTAANATLIAGGTPVTVAMLSAIFLQERITRFKVIGIAASLVGIVTIVGGATGLGASLGGNLLILASGTSWAIYLVIGRRAFSTASPLATLAGIGIAGFIIMAPFALFELFTDGVDTSRPTDLLLVLYLGIATGVAYLLVTYGLAHVDASLAAIYGNIQPLSGAGSGWLILGEPIGFAHVVGGAAIIFGVWLVSRGAVPERTAATRHTPSEG